MSKKSGKKKAKSIEDDSDMEVMPRIEIISEDTKPIIGARQEFQWVWIDHMIKDQNVPDPGLKDIPLYDNIGKWGITKETMCPDLFSCVEVIGWILPRIDPSTMIISNTKWKAFISFTSTYITKACKLPTPRVMMTNDWVKSVNLDIFECAKQMMVSGKKLR